MAIYHLSVKTVSRSAGRSATAAAAYRAGVSIADERTGEVFDYTRKGGVLVSEIVLPNHAPDWSSDRAILWNRAEGAETRKNSTVAREFEIALPTELGDEERKRLALDFAREIVARHGCAADVTIHAPGRGGDDRNHHAHILCSTRRMTREGFGEKTRELDDQKSGEVLRWRERFADLQNERLRGNGIREQVDHRSHEERGIQETPGRHLGVSATNYERRTGQASQRREEMAEIDARLARARDDGAEVRKREHDAQILDLSTDLEAVRKEQEQTRQKENRSQRERLEQGMKKREEQRERETDFFGR